MEPMKHTVKLEGLPEGWSGHVVMEAPLHTERMKVITGGKFHKLKGAKELKNAEKKLEALFEEQIPMLIKIYEENARKLILEVCIVGPAGEKIDSVEDFDRHPATAECFAEISAAYLEGFGPGKKKNKS